ncbi:hypothetical protein [Candidatus Sulfurimonas baltica]|uniref:Uncharacterized protein n=1 Tax=Candidatus Sulfurimonas baltica TaxID=2740404 RepID=A0A7S7RM44_9BACT|nr:hypothetical protein [Candidatus Sulfurimonas baltica]QOY51194.1 hypothetical protein HUE88_08625 [Candidatus Sulfurimonas baltica]
MNFYYVFTPKGISIEHSWSKVKSMINGVSDSGCQRFDNKPDMERWLKYVEKYSTESTISIFKSMIKEQKIIEEEDKKKQLISRNEIEIFKNLIEEEKKKSTSKKGLRIVKKISKK